MSTAAVSDAPPVSTPPPAKAKLLPSELGCDRPYSICYSGAMTFASPADATLVSHFVAAWQETAIRLSTLLREMLANPDEHLLLHLIIAPKDAPEWIANHDIFAELNEATGLERRPEDIEADKKDDRWLKYSDGNSFHLLRGLVKEAKHRAATPFRAVLARRGLVSTVVTPERFEHVFALLPGDLQRAGVGSAVAGIFKSFLSNRELARRENLAKIERRGALMAAHGAFFTQFDRYSRHVGAWSHCGAVFEKVREKLLKDHDRMIVNACQGLVAREHPEVPSWSDILSSQESRTLAEANPAIVQAFRDAFPTIVPPPKERESFLYRRFGRKANLRDLAADAHYLTRVLIMYRDCEGLFADETEVNRLIHWVEGRPKELHVGWLEICKDTKSPSFKALREFLRGPVRDWIADSRPIDEAVLADRVDSWPLFSEGLNWSIVPNPAPQDFRGVDGPGKLRGNEVVVSLGMPQFFSPTDPEVKCTRRVVLTAAVCGNLHRLTKARLLEAQLDVRNGMSQFRPGRKLAGSRDRADFHTYIKEQAMRIMVKDGKTYAEISATEMTETAADPTVTKEFRKNVRDGERVAVAHYLPGGDRLLSLMIFEKDPTRPAGWKEIPINEQIHRTDAERGNHNVAMKRHVVLNLQTSSLLYHLSAHEDHRMAGIEGQAPEVNAESMAAFGPARTQMGRTYYKQMAASIGKILRDHRVAYCLMAVAGHGLTSRGVRAPVNNFFAFSKSTGATGSFMVALQKSGVRLLVASGSYGRVDVRSFIASGNLDSLDWGISYHVETKGTKTVPIRFGRRDFLLCGTVNGHGDVSREYPRNACWACLLAAFNPEAEKAMDKTLDFVEKEMQAVEGRWVAFAPPAAS